MKINKENLNTKKTVITYQNDNRENNSYGGNESSSSVKVSFYDLCFPFSMFWSLVIYVCFDERKCKQRSRMIRPIQNLDLMMGGIKDLECNYIHRFDRS